MFIIGYLIILVLQANHLAVPGIVSVLVGVAALLETAFYIIIFLVTILTFMKER